MAMDRTVINENENRLSARDKGDIYWKKLKCFLQAVEDKNVSQDEARKRRFIAKRLIERENDLKEGSSFPEEGFIDGNEFKFRPPTASGEQSYEYALLKSIQNREYFKKLLSGAAKKSGNEEEKLVIKQLAVLSKILERTISTFFLANGINEHTGAPASSSERIKAKQRLQKEIRLYEDAVKQFRRRVAISLAKELKKETAAMGDESCACYTSSEEMEELKSLMEENRQAYLCHKEKLDAVTEELSALLKKKSEYDAELFALRKLSEKRGMDSPAVSFMSYSEMLREYEDYLRAHLSALEWAKEGCICCIRYLLAGEEPNPLMANYICGHWQLETRTIPIDTLVKELEGYEKAPEEREDFRLYSYDTMDELREGAKELCDYREKHPRQFSFQTISTVLFDTGELPEIVGKARALRNRAAQFMADGEEGELKEIRILAETMERVGEMVLEYQRDSAEKTLSELISSYVSDTRDMDYYIQEKLSEECLKKCYEKTAGM